MYLNYPYPSHLDVTLYNDEIDRVIRQILFSDKKPYGFRELKREVGKVMNHPNISFDTFSLHLKRMVYGRIIQKNAKKGCTISKSAGIKWKRDNQ